MNERRTGTTCTQRIERIDLYDRDFAEKIGPVARKSLCESDCDDFVRSFRYSAGGTDINTSQTGR